MENNPKYIIVRMDMDSNIIDFKSYIDYGQLDGTDIERLSRHGELALTHGLEYRKFLLEIDVYREKVANNPAYDNFVVVALNNHLKLMELKDKLVKFIE